MSNAAKSVLALLVFALVGLVGWTSAVPASPGGKGLAGGGTPGQIALWTGSSTLGNSNISQDVNGGVAVSVAGSGNAVGVQGTTADANGLGVRGEVTATTGNDSSGIWGSNSSNGNGVNGVYGQATASSGVTFGVQGISASPEGVGVQGSSTNVAVAGFNQSCTSAGCTMTTGTAGQFVTAPGGTILQGINYDGAHSNSVFRVDSSGAVFADGGLNASGADFAESFAVRGPVGHYEPGDLLVIDTGTNRRLALSRQPYSTRVAGIYSTKPGVLASEWKAGSLRRSQIPLAVVGVVPCKVSTENGPVNPGDLLVASSTPGYAMRGTDRARMLGAVVGKALEPLYGKKGVIRVLVTLQ